MLQEFEFSTRCMGCDLEVSLIMQDTQASDAESLFNALHRICQEYENIFSRFLTTSELNVVNQSNSNPFIVSDIFQDVFTLSQALYKDTHELFNPLMQVAKIGYNTTFTDIPNNQQAVDTVTYDANPSHIQHNAQDNQLTLANTQALDFGGFLKGHVAQKMAEMCGTCHGVIINLGGDIYTIGKDADNQMFKYYIYNPITDTYTIEVPIYNAALATSGNYKRVWHVGSVQYSHIVDTKTKTSTQTSLVSATVIHKSGAYADAYATVAMTLPWQEAIAFLEGKNVAFILIDAHGLIKSSLNTIS